MALATNVGYAVSMGEQRRSFAIDGLIVARLQAGPLGRFFVVVTMIVYAMQAGAMVVVRFADGPMAGLDGILARAISVMLFLGALPFAFRVARLGHNWPMDAGVSVLAHLRGYDARRLEERVPWLAAKMAAWRVALPTAFLGLFGTLLSLPDIQVATRRLVLATLLTLLAAAVATLLCVLGILAAKFGRNRGVLLLQSVLFVPYIIAIVPGVPDMATPTGLYYKAQAAILDRSPQKKP